MECGGVFLPPLSNTAAEKTPPQTDARSAPVHATPVGMGNLSRVRSRRLQVASHCDPANDKNWIRLDQFVATLRK
jgi:hypothetical protein